MRVEISAEAERDLRKIALHIADDDPQAAMRFVSKLRAACAALSDFPERFPLVPRYEQERIRHRAVGNYLILYRVDDERVTIIHIRHGAMDYLGLLDLRR